MVQAAELSARDMEYIKRTRRRLIGAIILVILVVILLPLLLEDNAGHPQTVSDQGQQQRQKPVLDNQSEIELPLSSQSSGGFDSAVQPSQPTAPQPPVAVQPKVSKEPPLPTQQLPAPAAVESKAQQNIPDPANTEPVRKPKPSERTAHINAPTATTSPNPVGHDSAVGLPPKSAGTGHAAVDSQSKPQQEEKSTEAAKGSPVKSNPARDLSTEVSRAVQDDRGTKTQKKPLREQEPPHRDQGARAAFIQVGVFSSEQSVINIKSKLAALHMKCCVIDTVEISGKSMMRVRSGPYVRSEAVKLLGRLQEQGVSGFVVNK